ncbi:MAG: CBS domain-containing protein [Lachnospiraceae bacterium]|nr:CBS domain-containing protein [Lachnospiraceae bacterium]
MYVKDHMTKNPITVTGDTMISKAVDIMAKNHFHRLPVVDEKGKLTGLITGGLVEESSGAKNTSLSIYELNYLLSRTKVSDIMIKDVTTVEPDVFIEEASQLMIDHEIAVLPVVDGDGLVIGIITEKDIFQAFNDLLGYRHTGTRFIIACEDHPGFLVGITKCFAEQDANLESLAVYRSERGTELVVKATGEISVESMTDILEKAGYRIIDIAQTLPSGEVKHFDP